MIGRVRDGPHRVAHARDLVGVHLRLAAAASHAAAATHAAASAMASTAATAAVAAPLLSAAAIALAAVGRRIAEIRVARPAAGERRVRRARWRLREDGSGQTGDCE